MAERVIALGGQSIPAALFTNTVPVMPVPRAGTFMWNQASASWVAPTGAGAIELANMLNAQTGDHIYLINGCVGGTALLQANVNPATPTQYWLNSAGSVTNSFFVAGARNEADRISGLRIAPTSGNITGTVTLLASV